MEPLCCQRWRAAKNHVEVTLKILQVFGARTPRHAVMAYEGMDKTVVAIGTMERCPCQDAPHPEAFRELVRRVGNRREELGLNGVNEIAEQVMKEFGIEG